MSRGDANKGSFLQVGPGHKIGVWWGDGDLARFKQHYSPPRVPSFSAPEATTVCGLTGERSFANVEDGGGGRGSKITDKGIVHEYVSWPALWATGVAFEHRSLKVLVVWEIDASKKAALDADTALFFSSLRCE